MNISLSRYVLNKRILEARKLLKEDLSVAQVAKMVGFVSSSHFSTVFKRMTGLSPKEYRSLCVEQGFQHETILYDGPDE